MNLSLSISNEEISTGTAAMGLPFAVGFFFSFRIAIAYLSVHLLGIDAREAAEANLALNFLLLVLVCFHSLGAVRHPLRSMLQLPSMRWVLVFLIFSCCSLAWSDTASLSASIAYWCGTATDVVMMVLLFRADPVSGVASSLMKGFVWGACGISLIAWIIPAQYDLRLGDEDFFNTNSIGNLCAFAIFFAQYLMRRKEGSWGLATLFLSVTLLRSLSKTTIVAFLISQAFLVIQDRSMSRKTKVILTLAAVLMVLVFWGLLESYYDVYTTAGNQAETLTGRTGIWLYVAGAAVEQPWIGHGFDSMWKVIPAFGGFEARHAENELLEQFYSYGVAGICILIGVYGSLFRQFRRLARGPMRVFFLSMLLYFVVRGLAEAEPFDLLFPLWAIVLISLLVDHISRSEEEAVGVVAAQKYDPSANLQLSFSESQGSRS